MSLELNTPLCIAPLDRVKLAAIKIEENKSRSQRWIEFWLVFGKLNDSEDPDSFVQYMDPTTGQEAKYIKLERGVHPLSPDRGLGKCSSCGKWFPAISGDCDVEGCTGKISYYDGWDRLVSTLTTGGLQIFEEIREIVYKFLTEEVVPDPLTGEMVKLLDARMEE